MTDDSTAAQLPAADPIEPDQIAAHWVARSLIISAIVIVTSVVFVKLAYPSNPGAIPRDPALRLPEPRLQLDEPADLRALREREAQHLNSYGWVDRASGTVHIPIERAMQLVLEEQGRGAKP